VRFLRSFKSHILIYLITQHAPGVLHSGSPPSPPEVLCATGLPSRWSSRESSEGCATGVAVITVGTSLTAFVAHLDFIDEFEPPSSPPAPFYSSSTQLRAAHHLKSLFGYGPSAQRVARAAPDLTEWKWVCMHPEGEDRSAQPGIRGRLGDRQGGGLVDCEKYCLCQRKLLALVGCTQAEADNMDMDSHQVRRVRSTKQAFG
jgi:hypothetical protein